MRKQVLWYHGGPRVTDWSTIRWDRERSQSDLNAEGPGMYWTTDLEEASSYMHGHADAALYQGVMRDGFVLLPKKRATMAALRAIYELADPDSQEVFLSNWNVEMPASRIEISHVLMKYTGQNTLFDAYVTLYHDLFRYDAEEYVGAMRALGYDGYVVERGTTGGSRRRKHLILWNPRAMLIEEAM